MESLDPIELMSLKELIEDNGNKPVPPAPPVVLMVDDQAMVGEVGVG